MLYVIRIKVPYCRRVKSCKGPILAADTKFAMNDGPG